MMNVDTARGALYEPPKIHFFSLLLETAAILAISILLVIVAG